MASQTVLYRSNNQIDPAMPRADYTTLCGLAADGHIYLDAPITAVTGTDTDGTPVHDGQYSEHFNMYYQASNDSAVVTSISGLAGLVTHSVSVSFGI
jgi:hypothetical protein